MPGKLYEVIKALSAMKLTKEDNVPDAILDRKSGEVAEGESPYMPSKPKIAANVSDLANAVPEDLRTEPSNPCLFQGSIGTAYNEVALKREGITHILTCAANLNPRFTDQF